MANTASHIRKSEMRNWRNGVTERTKTKAVNEIRFFYSGLIIIITSKIHTTEIRTFNNSDIFMV